MSIDYKYWGQKTEDGIPRHVEQELSVSMLLTNKAD